MFTVESDKSIKSKELSIKDYAILTDKELDLPAKHLAIGFYKGKQDLDKFKTNFVSNRLWELWNK